MSLSWEVVSIVQHNQHKYSHSAFVSRTQRATGHRLQPTDIYIFVELGLSLCGTNAVMTFSSVPKKKKKKKIPTSTVNLSTGQNMFLILLVENM